MLAEFKRIYPAWFGFLDPYLLLDTKGVLAALGGGESTKVPVKEPLHWELICSECSDAFESPGTPPENTI